MTVLVGPIRMPREGVVLRDGVGNPGIGGTEFVVAQSAFRLARTRDDVRLVTAGPGPDTGHGLATAHVVDLATFAPDPGDVVILPAASAIEIGPEQLRGCRVIITAHHPHDRKLVEVVTRHRPALVLSAGSYTYRSNDWIPVPHAYHRDPVVPGRSARPITRRASDAGAAQVVGHISSLHRVKGFGHVAAAWPDIVRDVPGATLDVVGGISLYGLEEAHPVLPTTLEFGDRLLSLLAPDTVRASVRFHGVTTSGIDEIISGWRLAILNPTGVTEADPASVKDCFRNGVPVLGGYDFGMVDYLRGLPELQLSRPGDIARQAVSLLRSPGLLEDLSGRVAARWAEIVEQDAALTERFIRIVAAFEEGDDRELRRLMSTVRAVPLGAKIRLSISRRRLHERRRRRRGPHRGVRGLPQAA